MLIWLLSFKVTRNLYKKTSHGSLDVASGTITLTIEIQQNSGSQQPKENTGGTETKQSLPFIPVAPSSTENPEATTSGTGDVARKDEVETAQVDKAVREAEEKVQSMRGVPSSIDRIQVAVESASKVITTSQSLLDTWGSTVDNMRIFVDITEALSDVRVEPDLYAKH